MADELINGASSFAGYQIETIDIAITSGSGSDRKLIAAVFEIDTIPTPTFNGVSPTNVIDSYTWAGEGDYNGKVFEWLDDDLPTSAGTYTLDANGERPFDFSILYGEGFNQTNATNALNETIDVAEPQDGEVYSITGTAPNGNYLLFSHHVGVDVWDNAASIGAGQIPVWGSSAETEIPPGGDTGQMRLSSYSVNGSTTHSYTMGENSGSGAIHIHAHALDAVGGGGGGEEEEDDNCGCGPDLVVAADTYDAPGGVMLKESSDTRTTGLTEPTQSIGGVGEYSKRVIWRRRGQHRSYTPIIRISDNVKRAVFTAYIKVEPCDR